MRQLFKANLVAMLVASVGMAAPASAVVHVVFGTSWDDRPNRLQKILELSTD